MPGTHTRAMAGSTSIMFERFACTFLNHLLAADGWAQARLKPFAGQHLAIHAGSFAAAFVVTGGGTLAPSASRDAAAVTIRLPDDALLRLPSGRASLLARSRIEGSADFAEALGFLGRHLQWDMEADLARIVGDIAAHRLVMGGRHLAAIGSDTLNRLQSNIAESLIDNPDAPVSRTELQTRTGTIADLADRLTRLEQRLERLR